MSIAIRPDSRNFPHQTSRKTPGYRHAVGLLFASVLLILQACAATQNHQPRSLIGRIWVIGNEPFTRLAVELDDKRLYYIKQESPVFEALWKLQGERVHLQIVKINSETEEILVSQYKLVQ